MPDEISSICCCEVEKVWAKVDDYVTRSRESIHCITEHPGFDGVALNPWVLETAYRDYKNRFGAQEGQLHE